MRRRIGRFITLTSAVFLTASTLQAQAQFIAPNPVGGFGINLQGNFVGTVEGERMKGLGVLASGMGYYNYQTALANSIEADTMMRWNQYLFLSQQEANRRYAETSARRDKRTKKAQAEIDRRLRENPDQRDIHSGSALNIAVDDITDPRAYYRPMKSAKSIVRREAFRDIPFQNARAGVSISINQLMNLDLPKALMISTFDSDRSALREIHLKIERGLEKGEAPARATLDEAKKIVETAHARAVELYDKNSRELVSSEGYLGALASFYDMLDSPGLSVLLVKRETAIEITLDQLILFMNAYNLRFGKAIDARQRAVYAEIYPMLTALRGEVSDSLAQSPPIPMRSRKTKNESYFSAVNYDDLKKHAAAPAFKNEETNKKAETKK